MVVLFLFIWTVPSTITIRGRHIIFGKYILHTLFSHVLMNHASSSTSVVPQALKEELDQYRSSILCSLQDSGRVVRKSCNCYKAQHTHPPECPEPASLYNSIQISMPVIKHSNTQSSTNKRDTVWTYHIFLASRLMPFSWWKIIEI